MFARVLGGLVGAGGALTAVVLNSDRLRASWTVNYEPVILWDHNWDMRDPCSCVKPIKDTQSTVEQNKYNEEVDSHKVRACRHIILVRHGQYLDRMDTDVERKLTKLGREQAELTGIRLKQLGIPFKRIVYSTKFRATETADIIARHVKDVPMEKCDFIREGAPPVLPEPKMSNWHPKNNKYIYVDGARIEAGFRRYFHRAEPSQKDDSYELVVCHANVIRYYLCRALQLPPEAWLRFSLHNASITWVTITPKGNVSVKCVGEAGFMPPDKLSTC